MIAAPIVKEARIRRLKTGGNDLSKVRDNVGDKLVFDEMNQRRK
jgi:hypothetical protein